MTERTISSEHLGFGQLLWLMPIAFAIHIGEEWFGGFPGYVAATLHGSPMSPEQFLLNNAGFMALLLCLSVWASRSGSRLAAFFLMVWASGNLFWDFFAHLFYNGQFQRLLARSYHCVSFLLPTSDSCNGYRDT